MISVDKSSYEGDFVNGQATDYGKFYDPDSYLVYDGKHKAGQFNGQGKLYTNGMLLYDGNFVNGTVSGQGKMFDASGNLLYAGEFADNKPTGNGIVYGAKSNVNVTITIHSNGSKNGTGTFNMPDGVKAMTYYEYAQLQAGK